MRVRTCARGLVAAVAAATVLMPGVPATAASQLAASRPESRTARVVTPTLVKRATLSADFQAPGPPSGAQATTANGRTGPFPGQVIPGFSAMVDNGNGTFWAMPDNGFGAKANSADFRLRIYLVKPVWETASGERAGSTSNGSSPCGTPTAGSTSRSSTRTPPAGC